MKKTTTILYQTSEGRPFGFMVMPPDKKILYKEKYGLMLTDECMQLFKNQLGEIPRIDRTNCYILVIPKNERDLFYLKMVWC